MEPLNPTQPPLPSAPPLSSPPPSLSLPNSTPTSPVIGGRDGAPRVSAVALGPGGLLTLEMPPEAATVTSTLPASTAPSLGGVVTTNPMNASLPSSRGPTGSGGAHNLATGVPLSPHGPQVGKVPQHVRQSTAPPSHARRPSMGGGGLVRKWETGASSICAAPGGCKTCCYVCFCVPCAAADIAFYTGKGWCDTCLLTSFCPLYFGPLVMAEDRVLFAKRVGIKDDTSLCSLIMRYQCGCCCCLLCQEHRQMMLHRERIRDEVARALTAPLPVSSGPTSVVAQPNANRPRMNPQIALPPATQSINGAPLSPQH